MGVGLLITGSVRLRSCWAVAIKENVRVEKERISPLNSKAGWSRNLSPLVAVTHCSLRLRSQFSVFCAKIPVLRRKNSIFIGNLIYLLPLSYSILLC